MGRQLNHLSIKKSQGASVGDLTLCLFRVNGQSIFQWYRNSFYHLFESGKNCFYRFPGRPDIDWRSLQHKVSLSFKRRCFITDDTFLEKTGCCIERVCRVFDHVSGSCKPGFKLLLLAFFDGTSTIGCDFTLALTLWERLLPLIAKIIEVLSEIIERTPGELIEQVLENKGVAKKFEYIFACIEQY
jgi:hypothetical protein